jgi:Protein of unknown function (DUF2630)
MNDAQIHETIELLVGEEHELWDLLRRRRALRDAGREPDEADFRRSEVVEGYEQ